MTWIEISLDTHAEHAERVGELLTAAGAIAVTLKSAGAMPLFEPDPGMMPLWEMITVVGLFEPGTPPDAVINHVLSHAERDQVMDYRIGHLADQAWERACLTDFHSLRFGARTWVCPSWDTAPRQRDAVVVHLDPGLAFGTGSHPTTALCLTWLDRHPPSDRQVVDYGCGSGILAVCAARHGASFVWAIDHDPQALEATRVNAAKNHVAPVIATRLPHEATVVDAQVLIANILADPLMELAPRFADMVAPGGTIVLAGLLHDQGDGVTAAYAPWFHMTTGGEREGWLLLEGQRYSTGTERITV